MRRVTLISEDCYFWRLVQIRESIENGCYICRVVGGLPRISDCVHLCMYPWPVLFLVPQPRDSSALFSSLVLPALPLGCSIAARTGYGAGNRLLGSSTLPAAKHAGPFHGPEQSTPSAGIVPATVRTRGPQTLFCISLYHCSLKCEIRVVSRRNFYIKICYAKEILVKIFSLQSQVKLLLTHLRKKSFNFFYSPNISELALPKLVRSIAIILALPSLSTSQQRLHACSVYLHFLPNRDSSKSRSKQDRGEISC